MTNDDRQTRLPQLRPYQSEPALAILDSITHRAGRTFTVMMARQAGKNELSAQLELLLLLLHANRPGAQGIKASPTYKPQTINSIRRLRERMAQAGLAAAVRSEHGYILGLGEARWLFFSAQPGANVVGATANLLLEADEAQDIEPDKWNRDFRPMGATANATAVLYGTAWSTDTLLEQTRQANRDAEARDGIRRNFEYPWTVVAEHVPDYGRYVEGEIARLGAAHPLIRTQYELHTLDQGGRLLSANQLALLQGDHPALDSPGPGITAPHVAGLDLAGQDELADDPTASTAPRSERDSTTLAIGYLASPRPFTLTQDLPQLRLCYARTWRGIPHAQLLPELEAQLRLWNVRRVAGDATGIGSGLVATLIDRLGSRVQPIVYTRRVKSELGFQALAWINAGRLLLPRSDDDPWPETRRQLAALRATYYPGGAVGWSVPETDGHDDLAHAVILAVHAAAGHRDRTARAR